MTTVIYLLGLDVRTPAFRAGWPGTSTWVQQSVACSMHFQRGVPLQKQNLRYEQSSEECVVSCLQLRRQR